MRAYTRKLRLRATLAGIAAAGLVLAACGKNLNIDGAAAKRHADPAYASVAMYGWTNHYARLTLEQNQPNNDVALLIKVKTALVKDPDLKAFPLEVGVLGGVVTLYGQVDTPERRANAERIARRVQGVAQVKSSIAVNTQV
jgi:osmotically-inducible protein OsmY